MIMAIIIMVVIIVTLPEVPSLDVVVETDAIGAAILGDDLHDILLLLWRKQVFAMMVAIVRAAASAEIIPDTSSSLSHVSMRNVVIELCKAPCFPHEPLFTERLARSVLPGRRIDGLSVIAFFWHQQPGLIMHATRLIGAFIVETQGISHWNIIVSQFLFFHI